MENETLKRNDKEQSELILTQQDFDDFRSWLQLNLDAVTWQGRYRQEFEEFWELFFVDGLSLSQLSQRFEYAKRVSKIGPLTSWFSWLRNKLCCYLFIYKKITLLELSQQDGRPASEMASIMRSFLIDHYPHLDEELSEMFQVVHLASPGVHLSYDQVSRQLRLDSAPKGSHDDEIMTSMEVTLYDEWMYFIRKMRKEVYGPHFDLNKIAKRASFSSQIRILRDIFLLLIVGAGVVISIQQANIVYEKYLLDKISVYEPDFDWLDSDLVFKTAEGNQVVDFQLDIDDIDTIDDVEDVASQFDIVDEEERFDTESEVTLTSWDSLPRDFNVANLEVSSYEELETKGYRDSRYGNTKVYRILMKSVDTNNVKSKLNILLDNYKVTQVDNVKPGQEVPGGIYYNLFVPRERLKEFVAQVMEVDNSILYESRTRAGRNPVGKNKVFIWVKNI